MSARFALIDGVLRLQVSSDLVEPQPLCLRRDGAPIGNVAFARLGRSQPFYLSARVTSSYRRLFP
jgi:hypothetical protein